ncbi:MAG: hypothetical protein ACI8W8_001579 [Rhodothermales bacterium]|jgi:hypothetical protein
MNPALAQLLEDRNTQPLEQEVLSFERYLDLVRSEPVGNA